MTSPEMSTVQLQQARAQHRHVIAASLLVMLASFLLTLDSQGRVSVPGTSCSLPVFCISRLFMQLECPGCGLTRSFVAFAHGDWQRAWEFHRLGWLLFLLVAGQIPYRWQLLRAGATHRPWRAAQLIEGAIFIAVLINWAGDVITR